MWFKNNPALTMTEAVLSHQEAPLNDKFLPSSGKGTLIEPFCDWQTPVVEVVMKAKETGKLKNRTDEALAELPCTAVLAHNLGFPGALGMTAMPVNGATADNVTIILGGADQMPLQATNEKASAE